MSKTYWYIFSMERQREGIEVKKLKGVQTSRQVVIISLYFVIFQFSNFVYFQ